MAFLPDELESLIQESGVPFKRNSRSFVLDCPRCSKKRKLWILKHNGAFVCWNCAETDNYRGWADEALSDILGTDRQSIRARIYDGALPPGNLLNVELHDFDSDDLIDMPDTAVTLDEIEWPWDVVDIGSYAGVKGLHYLQGRGVSLVQAQKYDIKYWPSQRRVVFPVKVDGKLVGYQGRSIDANNKAKILTSTGLRREYVLMFQDNLKGSEHAIVCEGPMDAIKADLCGGNVATMGKAVSAPQLKVLRGYGIKRIYLALDPDAADEITRLAYELGDMETRLLLPPDGKKDLGECSFEEVYEAFKAAQPFTAGHLLFGLRLRT